ncbi:MAG: beta-glycosidase [Prevotella sp.]|nr:beta-glycosidase [Prevotella sp.]
MKLKKTVILLHFIAFLLPVEAQKSSQCDRIDLAGEWEFALEPQQLQAENPTARLAKEKDSASDLQAKRAEMRVRRPSEVGFENAGFKEIVTLPGTTDTNKKGNPCANRTETTHLTRLYSYKGKAWYARTIDIPKAWKGRKIQLFLERTKSTEVYIDGQLIGSSNDISTPQRFNISPLKPGKHRLSVMVDNSSGVPEQVYGSSHAYTEDTQTNWNGIIGEIFLSVEGLKSKKKTVSSALKPQPVNPVFRDFHVEGQHFYADGKLTFLRGRHDACVWPLTAHVAMDIDSWRRYMQICKDYGLNHVRFHSWCPPEACFQAADEAGIYLQPELPFWGDFNEKDSVLMAFLLKEGENILREYGHHPSFVMFALGNELWGSVDEMGHFVRHFRQIAPDKLYTFGSNYYLGYQGVKPDMDYFTTCRNGGEAWGAFNTHTRGSFSFADALDGGILNHFYPNTSMTLDEGCRSASVPIISHETGQFQTYPDYDEIAKYTGVLYPYNMEEFRKRLERKGMLSQAKDFHRASGKWSTLLYKADIELDLRTRSMAGFQLLDLQDYPGQGSAYVGILDAFMDSKNLIQPSEWRQFCNDVVPLMEMDSYTYSTEEEPNKGADCMWSGTIKVANYSGKSLKGRTVRWTLRYEDGTVHSSDTAAIATDSLGLFTVETVVGGICGEYRNVRLNLQLEIEGTPYYNTYPMWVYTDSRKTLNDLKEGIIVTQELSDEIGKKLQQGGKVLWMPVDSTLALHTVGPLFQTDYWNYRMFKTICENNKKPVSPGTLGILTNPKHPIFGAFPTEEHTNWQWFPVVKNSRPLILDNFWKEYRPIVQVIDNVERNHKLGLVMEFGIGNGRLLICMSDLEKASQYPEGRAFYRSLLEYMHSEEFRPKDKLQFSALKDMLTREVKDEGIDELKNISFE